MRTVVAVLALLALAACSVLPGEMAGEFRAKQDMIVVKKDGSLFWVPDAASSDQMQFVGIASRDAQDSQVANVSTYSTSQVWPKLTYSPDFSTVAIDWREAVTGTSSGRSTEFIRIGGK